MSITQTWVIVSFCTPHWNYIERFGIGISFYLEFCDAGAGALSYVAVSREAVCDTIVVDIRPRNLMALFCVASDLSPDPASAGCNSCRVHFVM